MIWGLEGHHAWTPPGALEPAIVLNRSHDDAGKPIWPRYTLVEVPGLMGLGDAEAINDAKVGRPGENARLSQRRGKSVGYVGMVQARSLRALRLAESALREAFADCATEGRMDVSPHPGNVEFEDDPPKFFFARALGLDDPDAQGPPTAKTFGYERTFVLGLRMSDARYFDDETFSHAVTISKTNTTYEFT